MERGEGEEGGEKNPLPAPSERSQLVREVVRQDIRRFAKRGLRIEKNPRIRMRGLRGRRNGDWGTLRLAAATPGSAPPPEAPRKLRRESEGISGKKWEKNKWGRASGG
jgi:hypothetical protein